MKDAYNLEIPALLEVLKEEDIAVVELFLWSNEKGGERMNFHVADAENCYTFKNTRKNNENSTTVQINFGKKKISISQEDIESETVNRLFRFSLLDLFLKIEEDRIQFLTFSRKAPSNKSDTRM